MIVFFPFRVIITALDALVARLTALDSFLREQFTEGAPGPNDSAAALGLRLAIGDKPGTRSGAIMSLALAFNDREFAEGTLVPSTVDLDGKTIVDPATGLPIDVSVIPITYVSSDPSVVDVGASSGQAFNFQSGNPGPAKVTASIGPYPAGHVVTFDFDCIVGNSAPGDPVVAVEVKPEP